MSQETLQNTPVSFVTRIEFNNSPVDEALKAVYVFIGGQFIKKLVSAFKFNRPELGTGGYRPEPPTCEPEDEFGQLGNKLFRKKMKKIRKHFRAHAHDEDFFLLDKLVKISPALTFSKMAALAIEDKIPDYVVSALTDKSPERVKTSAWPPNPFKTRFFEPSKPL